MHYVQILNQKYKFQEMEMLTNFKFVQDLARQLIQPRPSNYLATDICTILSESKGKHISDREQHLYESVHFNIQQNRTLSLHLIQSVQQKNDDNLYPSTCIIYLHGLSSFCVEGVFLVENLKRYFNEMNVSLCLYDLRGHGKDKAQNVTFGLKQSQELYQLLLYLKNKRNFNQFILWGRSMGATTILKMVTDFNNDLKRNEISIKYLVLDSAFSSFDRVATQIISKKSGMPQIFCHAIFEYLVAAIQRIYKLNLAVNISRLSEFSTNSLFLYSQIDSLVNPDHTKGLYKSCSGPKDILQMNVGHNEQRPEHVLIQVFQRLQNCLVNQPKVERRRSRSAKKLGLSVTKNKRVITLQSTTGEEYMQIKGKIEKLHREYNKENMKDHSKKIQQPIKTNIEKESPKSKCYISSNSMKLSPKPFKIAKQNQKDLKISKKLITLAGSNKLSPNLLKENINNTNLLKPDYMKRQKKLKLSHKDLIGQDSFPINQEQIRHRTSIYENISSSQCKVAQKSFHDSNDQFNEFKQAKSVFLIRNDHQHQQNTGQTLKNNYLKKKYEDDEFIHKKLSLNQSGVYTPYCCNWTIQKINPAVPKPQSQNIAMLKRNNAPQNGFQNMHSTKKYQHSSQMLQKDTSSNIRRNIEAELSKKQSIQRYNQSCVLNSRGIAFENKNKNIVFNFNSSEQKKVGAIHRLSNQLYI